MRWWDLLEGGLPTVRNKNAGHGQGPTPVSVPDYLVAYALHMAAANIVLLIQAHRRALLLQPRSGCAH
jgi:hypothetical protein